MLNKYEFGKMYHRSIYYSNTVMVRLALLLAVFSICDSTWSRVRYEQALGNVKTFLYQIDPFGQVAWSGEGAVEMSNEDQAHRVFIMDFLRSLRSRSEDRRFKGRAEHRLALMVDPQNLPIFMASIKDDPETGRCSRDVLVQEVLPVGTGADRIWRAEWDEVSWCGTKQVTRRFGGHFALQKRKRVMMQAGELNPLGLVVTTMDVDEAFDRRETERLGR